MNMEATVMLTSDVARRLNCSTDNVRVLERTGQLPAGKTKGGVRLFNHEDVERFARRRADAIDTRGSHR